MHNERLNTIIGTILAVLIVAAVVTFSIANAAKMESRMTEETTPATSAPTEPATLPAEKETAPETTGTTEPTKETTPTETEPPVATEPPTEPETQPTETDPEETAQTYTPEDLELLALVIYQEAGGNNYSDETRLMVGSVVMNRVKDNRFPNTIYDVLMQKGQYGLLHWTGPVWPATASHETEALAVERAYAIAERILLGERALPEDVLWQAEFVQGTEVVAFQDGNYFCR